MVAEDTDTCISDKGPLALIGIVVDRGSAFGSPPQVILLTEPQGGGQLFPVRVVGHITGKKSQAQGTWVFVLFCLITGYKSGCLAMEENSIFIILNSEKTYLFPQRKTFISIVQPCSLYKYPLKTVPNKSSQCLCLQDMKKC